MSPAAILPPYHDKRNTGVVPAQRVYTIKLCVFILPLAATGTMQELKVVRVAVGAVGLMPRGPR